MIAKAILTLSVSFLSVSVDAFNMVASRVHQCLPPTVGATTANLTAICSAMSTESDVRAVATRIAVTMAEKGFGEDDSAGLPPGAKNSLQDLHDDECPDFDPENLHAVARKMTEEMAAAEGKAN